MIEYILEDFLELKNKQIVDISNFINEINSVTTINEDKFKDLQNRGKSITQILNYTFSKIHDEIIPALVKKDKFNDIDNRVKMELEPVLHEKRVLELEIMEHVVNDMVSPLIYQMIQRDSVGQYNLPCEYMFDIYDIKNKTKKGLIETILEDTKKVNTDMYIYKMKVNYDDIIIIIYDGIASILLKNNGVIDVYTLERLDMIDFVYLNFGEDLKNIHKINRFLLQINRHDYDSYTKSYLRRYLFMATLFKL